MKALDLFCGGGGATVGMMRAGFEVTGVDIAPQKRYPGHRFIQADALAVPLSGYDFIWASPPCQAYSIASQLHRNNGTQYPDLIAPIRLRLRSQAAPWVIENVVGAPLGSHVLRLCGLMFGLHVFRHRLFECSHCLLQPWHPPHAGKRIGEGYFSVAGGTGRWKSWGRIAEGVRKGNIAECRAAMGIDWMVRRELTQAIPPAYSEYLARFFLTKSI